MISPWNYPLAMANNLIVSALMAGNTVVFKPSEETPLVADLFVSLLNRVLPGNVLQIVHGSGIQGQALVESPVNIIAFTGSRAAGKDIMARAAGGIKRLVMEQEETFGPVVAISRFTTVDDAVRRANNSPYGLGAVVFGKQEAREVADRLEAGMVGINQGVGAGDAPWVGAKESGFGFHGTHDGHRQFAQVRVLGY